MKWVFIILVYFNVVRQAVQHFLKRTVPNRETKQKYRISGFLSDGKFCKTLLMSSTPPWRRNIVTHSNNGLILNSMQCV